MPNALRTEDANILYFRFVLMKYSDRGLADDRFWFNGGLRLFQILFWFANIFFILSNLGIISIHFIYHQRNVFARGYRSDFFHFIFWSLYRNLDIFDLEHKCVRK